MDPRWRSRQAPKGAAAAALWRPNTQNNMHVDHLCKIMHTPSRRSVSSQYPSS